MTILCGTDFSDAARRAVVAAAQLARLRRTGVRLVHVLDIPGAEAVLSERTPAKVTEFFEAEARRLLAQLEEQAAPVRALAPVLCEVLAGDPASALVEHGERMGAEIVVVSAVGRRGERLRALGRTADRVAQRARRPVVVVRDEAPFQAWAAGARPLRVLVGLDLSPTSDAALRWTTILRAAGPCVVSGVHVFWPPQVRERFHAAGLPIGAAEPEVEAALERELSARVAQVAPDLGLRLRLVGGMGRVAGHVAQVAADAGADLLVIGTHQRQGLDRLWHGSVSRDAIVSGPCNVAVVPV
jgi:nucleotide-binding universal stress UspA family protein